MGLLPERWIRPAAGRPAGDAARKAAGALTPVEAEKTPPRASGGEDALLQVESVAAGNVL